MLLKQLRLGSLALLVFIILTGLVYPLVVTGIAQLFFPSQANGSLIYRNSRVAGSSLIGQPFDDPKYFWGRPSATSPYPYNASASGGSNLGPSSPALTDAVQARITALKQANQAAGVSNDQPIPVDLVTASASGLDPNISPAAALYQAPRIAKLRGLSEQQVVDLVDAHTQGRQFGFLGEPRVNVLSLNQALDDLSYGTRSQTP